jgi:hypothetical protein
MDQNVASSARTAWFAHTARTRYQHRLAPKIGSGEVIEVALHLDYSISNWKKVATLFQSSFN